MTPETWSEIDSIVANALDLPESARAGYVADACRDRPELRGEVESLLGMCRGAANLFPTETAGELSSQEAPAPSMLGRRAGAYVLIQEIGRGGMGAVYRGERADDEFRKSVAVKLIGGPATSPETVSRFAVERQILATLEHPNIARLLDAGISEDGCPYIVMEYVEGLPVTDYCAARRLSIEQKLRLFHRVCAAVHFAHQHLIVHRDLKPANILVTGEGVPKLLDFGIAKLLNPEASALQQTLAAIPMTPDYASPEQARGVLLTTASDIYSLGVILYELLTESRPYRVAGRALEEVLHAVCDQEPAKPSAVARASGQKVAVDLDAITLKAMRKDPQERYASAEQFSADIQRYLAGLPVAARGVSWSYSVRKFVARNKAAVAASAVACVLAMAGVGGVLWQAHIAEGERARAERRFNDVRALANSVIFEIHDQIKDLPGSTPARKILVERALHYVDSLAREARGDTRLEAELAAAYERLGDVQGHPRQANLGDTQGSLDSFQKALALRESLAARQPDFDAQRARWADVNRVSECLAALGRNAEIAGFYRRGLPIAEAYARGRTDTDIQEWLAGAYYSAATVLLENADLNEALDYYQRSAAIRERISDPTGPLEIRTRLAGSYGNTAYVLALQRRFRDAVETQRKAVVAMEELVARDPENTTLRMFRSQGYLFLADFLHRQGRAKEALAAYRTAGQMYGDLAASDPRNVLAERFLAESYRGMGAALIDLGGARQGIEHLRKALGIVESLPLGNPKNLDVLGGIADTCESLGVADEALGNWRAALAWYRRSQQIWDEARRQRGRLHPGDAGKPERLRSRIARCERRAAGS